MDWRSFLETFNRDLLGSDAVGSSISPQARASGWLGHDGATPEQIDRAEARLGAHLPPSYREFLAVSNGWGPTGPFIDRLWPVESIDWFRVRRADWIAAYTMFTGAGFTTPDEEVFIYGDGQDPARFRPEVLADALEISDEGDSAITLLNPRVVTPDGEWEAWFFANWLPGAIRYRSFADLMVAARDEVLREDGDSQRRMR